MNLAKIECVGRCWRWGEYWGSAIVDCPFVWTTD